MTEQELKIIADRFGCICNYSPSDEEMDDEWCEEHCGTVDDWECWKRWLDKKKKEAEE